MQMGCWSGGGAGPGLWTLSPQGWMLGPVHNVSCSARHPLQLWKLRKGYLASSRLWDMSSHLACLCTGAGHLGWRPELSSQRQPSPALVRTCPPPGGLAMLLPPRRSSWAPTPAGSPPVTHRLQSQPPSRLPWSPPGTARPACPFLTCEAFPALAVPSSSIPLTSAFTGIQTPHSSKLKGGLQGQHCRGRTPSSRLPGHGRVPQLPSPSFSDCLPPLAPVPPAPGAPLGAGISPSSPSPQDSTPARVPLSCSRTHAFTLHRQPRGLSLKCSLDQVTLLPKSL